MRRAGDRSSAGSGPRDTGQPAPLPTTAPSRVIDRGIRALGTAVSWLWLGTIAAILAGVVARYVFATGSVLLEEVQWHLAAVAWLMGLSYALVDDAHVRMDLLYDRFSRRTRACVELFGLAVLLLPFAAIAAYELIPYVATSWHRGEESTAPGGLPARYLLKAAMLAAFLLIFAAGVSRVLKCTALLFGWPRPVEWR